MHNEYQKVGVICVVYRDWLQKRRISMKQVHRGGEKMFVDYSGKRPHLVSFMTGESTAVELFVCVLGASSYTYAEATLSQKVPDFIGSHVRAFNYFGGVAGMLVPDQLKSAVTKACRYEPGLHESYVELADHYGTSILPARPRKPKDKAKVEVAVQVAQRWILARLRNETFYTLAELNKRIWELLADMNDRKMKAYGGRCRSRCVTSRSRDAFPSTRWRYSTTARASRRTEEASKSASTRPSPSTCRRRIKSTYSGRRRAF